MPPAAPASERLVLAGAYGPVRPPERTVASMLPLLRMAMTRLINAGIAYILVLWSRTAIRPPSATGGASACCWRPPFAMENGDAIRQLNLLLRPRLRRSLGAQARIVSPPRAIGDWPPSKTELVANEHGISQIYLWRLERKSSASSRDDGNQLRSFDHTAPESSLLTSDALF